MQGDASRVIVTQTPGAFTTQIQTHHKDFPEIRAEGGTSKESGTQLVHHLTRALDTALTDWRRDSMQRAIADVQAFVEKG